MEQAVIIVIFLIVSFVNWLSKQAEEKRAKAEMEGRGAKREQQAGSQGREERGPQETLRPQPTQKPQMTPEEERIRKFYEALGLPVEPIAPSPPPVSQRQQPPEQEGQRARRQASPEPVLAPVAKESHRRAASAENPYGNEVVHSTQPKRPVVTLSREEEEALQRIKSDKSKGIGSFPQPGQRAVRSAARKRTLQGSNSIQEALALLTSPQMARKAVILREILDSPVGLRGPGISSNF